MHGSILSTVDVFDKDFLDPGAGIGRISVIGLGIGERTDDSESNKNKTIKSLEL